MHFHWPGKIIGFVDYHTIMIVGLYNDRTGLYSLLVPYILPPILLPELRLIVNRLQD